MKKVRKSKAHRIFEAVEELNKAMALEAPHISINLPYALGERENRRFLASFQAFIKEYKDFYGLKKVRVDIFL